MEGRQGMAISSGSAQYYIHRGDVNVGGSSAAGQGGVQALSQGQAVAVPAFRSISGSGGPAFGIGSSQGVNMSVVMGSGRMPASAEPVVKKKRGRPRKYAPDGSRSAVSLALSPMSSSLAPKDSSSSAAVVALSGSSSSQKKRGRPPGSGRKQILASIGGWMNSSAGMAFAPHVIHISGGEDIAAKILSFSQQRPRAICILSGTGTIASVTLHQPASSASTVRYEGLFEILCLSGSYLVAEEGGPRSRTGGISVSLSTPDGHVIGGAVAVLIAAGPVQVVGCSFLYDGSKVKDKVPGVAKGAEDAENPGHDSAAPTGPPTQNYTTAVWPGSRLVDQRDPHINIDLSSG